MCKGLELPLIFYIFCAQPEIPVYLNEKKTTMGHYQSYVGFHNTDLNIIKEQWDYLDREQKKGSQCPKSLGMSFRTPGKSFLKNTQRNYKKVRPREFSLCWRIQVVIPNTDFKGRWNYKFLCLILHTCTVLCKSLRYIIKILKLNLFFLLKKHTLSIRF